MSKNLDSDRAVNENNDDLFGFVGIAERLAPSIIEASKGDGMVIGLEGRWGSGKTSLLNYLRAELTAAQNQNIYTITVAPWLNGDAASLVSSVLDPIAEALDQRERQVAENSPMADERIVEKAYQLRSLLTEYGSKTARNLSPIAKLAGYAVPGMQVVGDALGTAADALENVKPNEQTPTELKEEIVKKLQSLDIGFVVILDDLDRLEPSQAIEVVRLVRSVADFPKIAYLMCYDRDVLADALSEGLKVKDGDLFLQKIVQLTFAIPLPEPFDLRAQFRKEALKLYREIHGEDLTGDALNELLSAIDREGGRLVTPREVKLALNGIRFVYPSVCDDVYYPDFCRLHLIKITHFKFYKWLETYLATRSIIVSGDGRVISDEKKRLGKELKKLLPSNKTDSSLSLWHASTFVPGIATMKPSKETVFGSTPAQLDQENISLKRLGSPLHYRFYFALTGPKTVLPDEEFNELIRLSKDDVPGLLSRLLTYATEVRESGKTWFEHVLDRLNDAFVLELNEEQLVGIITGICDSMDAVMKTDKQPRFFQRTVEGAACRVVEQCMSRLQSLNADRYREIATWIARNGSSLNWLIGEFFRQELFDHGCVGDRPTAPEKWVFSEELLGDLLKILQERLADEQVQSKILELPNVASFMYGWRDISGVNVTRAWVAEVAEDEEIFLNLLEALRSYAVSDRVYFPLPRSAVDAFFDFDDVEARLENLSSGKYREKVQEIRQAMTDARDY